MSNTYDPATRPCATGTTPGCNALQRSILGHWACTNVGTYKCRPTADGAPSVHGNGRAGDIGGDPKLIQEIADWLVANHTVLGVQLVIANHKIWAVNRAAEHWRPYGCDKPGSKKDHHTSHVHWEVNIDAGQHLSTAVIAGVLPHAPNPQPQPPPEDPVITIYIPTDDDGNTHDSAGNALGPQIVDHGDWWSTVNSDAEHQKLKAAGARVEHAKPFVVELLFRSGRTEYKPR